MPKQMVLLFVGAALVLSACGGGASSEGAFEDIAAEAEQQSTPLPLPPPATPTAAEPTATAEPASEPTVVEPTVVQTRPAATRSPTNDEKICERLREGDLSVTGEYSAGRIAAAAANQCPQFTFALAAMPEPEPPSTPAATVAPEVPTPTTAATAVAAAAPQPTPTAPPTAVPTPTATAVSAVPPPPAPAAVVTSPRAPACQEGALLIDGYCYLLYGNEDLTISAFGTARYRCPEQAPRLIDGLCYAELGRAEVSAASTPFANCTEARAAGRAGQIMFGDSDYASHLDADHDGIACEE